MTSPRQVPETHPNIPDWMRRSARSTNQLILEHEPHWEDLRFSAGSIVINPVGGVAAPTPDNVEASWPGTLLFAGAADNIIAGMAQMPHGWVEGTVVRPHVHVAKTTASALAMTWQLYYRRANTYGALFEGWQGPVVGTPSPADPGVADQPFMIVFGDVAMTGYLISTLLAWRVYRRGAADAYNADCRLFEFDIHYQHDSFGSDDETTKFVKSKSLR